MIKNQHAQTLWYLVNWDSFSLVDVIKDSTFVKFQTRLSDLEARHGILAKRKSVKFKNRFGRNSSYFVYSAVSKETCKLLLDTY